MPDIHFDCPRCNQTIDAPGELANQLIECPTCKQTIEVPLRTRKQPQSVSSATGQTDESAFFQSGDISVTNARFTIGTKTFAIRGITSVQNIKTPASYTWPFIVAVGGLVVAFNGFSYSVWLGLFGIVTICQGIWFATKIKPTFALVLTTAGGEVTAYRSDNREVISKIAQALNDSIISHG